MKASDCHETEDRPSTRRFWRGSLGIAFLIAALGLTSCTWFPWLQQVELALIPAQGAVRTTVNLVGEGFGDVQGDASVLFDGVEAFIETWSDMLIVARIPVVATPGGSDRSVAVSVWRGGEEIATAPFTLVRGVLFMSRRDGNSEIYVMNPDGSQQSNLTSHPSNDSHGCWSPDGTKIAFVSSRDGNSEIYVMDADGANPTNLTQHSGGDWSPCWAPDGSKIAFQTDREGSMVAVEGITPQIMFSFNLEIFVMNADGSGQMNLSQHPSWDGFPSWTADGNRIVFQTDRHATGIMVKDIVNMGFELYIMNANGSVQTRLTYAEGDDVLPVCSPVGSTILYQSDEGGDWEICTIGTDGSAQTSLTGNVIADVAATWSPSGEWITFQSMRDGNQEIYKMRADGSMQTRLTTDSEWDWGASWSADGSMIVFESWRDASGGGEIYRMNADGSSPTRLTTAPDWDTYPVWHTVSWEGPA